MLNRAGWRSWPRVQACCLESAAVAAGNGVVPDPCPLCPRGGDFRRDVLYVWESVAQRVCLSLANAPCAEPLPEDVSQRGAIPFNVQRATSSLPLYAFARCVPCGYRRSIADSQGYHRVRGPRHVQGLW